MSSAGDNLFAKKVTTSEVKATDVVCTDLTSSGTITWQNFSPPITADGNIDTLAATLNAGNTANNQSILNLKALSMHEDDGTTIMNPADGHMVGVQLLDANAVTCTTATILINNVGSNLTFDPNAGGTVIEGSTLANNKTVCTNLDLTSATNLFPSSIDDDTLGDVMTRGNQASTTLNMNTNIITNCQTVSTNEVATPLVQFNTVAGTQLNGSNLPSNPTVCTHLDLRDATNLFPTSLDDDNLTDVLGRGNDAGGLDITNVAQLDCANAQVGTAGTPGQLSVVGTVNATSATIPYINLNWAPGSDPANPNPNAKIDFTGIGGEGQKTEIEGDDTETAVGSGIPQRTKCSYLDLTDATNLHPAPTEERYEWGGYWRNPQTLKINQGQAAGLIGQVFMGAEQNNNDITGWRFFRPCSDGEEQIIPTTDALGDRIEKFHYLPYSSPPANDLAFYVLTAPTTIAAHNAQIVTLNFPVTRFGYGRIYLGLYYVPNATPTATPVFIDQSFRLLTENITQPGLADLRKGGEIQFTWVLRGIPNYPVDGSQWRLYPVLRTDDSFEYGAIEIRIGNDQPKSSVITGSRNGQLSMYGRPYPQTYKVFGHSESELTAPGGGGA